MTEQKKNSDLGSKLSPAEKEAVKRGQSEDIQVVSPTNDLKDRVGAGGFDPIKLQKAEKRFEDAAIAFSTVLDFEVQKIKPALATLRDTSKEAEHKKALLTIRAAAFDLRDTATMFKNPFVSEIAGSLFDVMNGLKNVSPTLLDAIDVHYNTFQLALTHNIQSSTSAESRQILTGLQKVRDKAMQNHSQQK